MAENQSGPLECGAFPPLSFCFSNGGETTEKQQNRKKKNKSGGKAPHSKWLKIKAVLWSAALFRRFHFVFRTAAKRPKNSKTEKRKTKVAEKRRTPNG